MKRLFDIIAAILVLIMGLPFFIIIALLIVLDGKGGVFYSQERIGRYKRSFNLYKFRTMQPGSDNLGQLTIGSKDSRVTSIGYYLRKYKIDEFPQLINIPRALSRLWVLTRGPYSKGLTVVRFMVWLSCLGTRSQMITP